MSFLAPGALLRNTLRPKRTAGRILANFNQRTTRAGQNVDGDPEQLKARILRPGAILLANLDIDQAGPRTRFTYEEVDASNNTVDEGDDDTEVTLFIVEERTRLPATTASRVDLEIDPADARRVRIWMIPAEDQPRGGTVRMGPGSGLTGPRHNYKVAGHWMKSPDRWRYCFVAEAVTLAGDPRYPAPSGAVPPPPGQRTPAPAAKGGSQRGTANASNVTMPTYPQRAEGDVWLSLVHYDWWNNPIADICDRGLFTIAPWIMTWNTLLCERVYVMYHNPNQARGRNHGMVWDLQQACAAAGLRNPAPHQPSLDSTLAIPTNQPGDIRTGGEIPFYVIDGARVDSRWVQDEFEIGYCRAPHKSMQVILHCVRSWTSTGGLAHFVEQDMAHAGLGIFNGLALKPESGSFGIGETTPKVDSVNSGGNLEVSPPVDRSTPAMPAGDAGPAVRAHRPAPFGKILLGDAAPRRCRDDFRNFLRAQRVQPILPLDTAWLSVGHVDEILTFVRAPGRRSNGDYEFKLLFADFDALASLYQEVVRLQNTATLHAGKYVPHLGRYVGSGYDEQSVRSVITGADFIASRWLQVNKLTPIETRLKLGLSLADSAVVPVPCYFTEIKPPPNRRVVARTPAMVNMLVVNDHLMIPRPFGPRLTRADATHTLLRTLGNVFQARGLATPATVIPNPPVGAGGDGLYYWAVPGETLDNIASYFVQSGSRKGFINAIRNGTPVPATHQVPHATLKTAILNHAFNTGAPKPIDTACPTPARVFDRWMRVWVPDGRVDVTEAYMHSVLAPTGNTLHFIDDFESYHADGHGDVHCGTNVKRRPPEELGRFRARWWNIDNYDAAYDTSY